MFVAEQDRSLRGSVSTGSRALRLVEGREKAVIEREVERWLVGLALEVYPMAVGSAIQIKNFLAARRRVAPES